MKLSIRLPARVRVQHEAETTLDLSSQRGTGKSPQAFASRYRGLILSILFFLLLVFGILVFNYFGSRWISTHTEEVLNVAHVQGQVNSVVRGLQDLSLSANENPNTPYIRGIRERMVSDVDSLERAFAAFQRGDFSGGEVAQHGHAEEAISATVAVIAQEWSYMQAATRAYLAAASGDDGRMMRARLDGAVYQAQESVTPIHNGLRSIGASIREAGDAVARKIQWVQIAGVVLGLLYFSVFILFFVGRLKKVDREALEARRETMEIMDTVAEGLFLVDKDLNIGREYSRELENILGTTDIAGRRLDSLLDAIVLTSDMSTVKEFVAQLFNPRVKARLINDLNPLDRIKVASQKDDGRGAVHYLSFGFSRVYQEKEILRVLVSVRDITRQVNLEERLERERQQNDEQIELLTSILRVDETMLNGFIRQAFASTEAINQVLQRPDRTAADMKGKVNAIFREVHSLKGEASALELAGFVAVCSDFENKLKELQEQDTLQGDDFLRPAVLLESLITMTERVESLAKRIGSFDTRDVIGDEAGGVTLAHKRSTASTYNAYLERFTRQVAERNGKQVKAYVNGFDSSGLDHEALDQVRDLAIQLVRNAVVHGIETPAVRRERNKPETGNLNLQLSESEDGFMELCVEDDGNGIDYEAIRARAATLPAFAQENVAGWSQQQILRAMFASGLSTLDAENEDGGRGVGMDVIRNRLRNLGGKLQVATYAHEFTRFVVRFPRVADAVPAKTGTR